MTYTHNHILLSEAWNTRITPDATGDLSVFLPSNGMSCETATEWIYSGRYLGLDAPVESMEFALVPQICLPHSTSYQNSRPVWVDVTPASLGITSITGAQTVTTGTPRLVIADQSAGTKAFHITVPTTLLNRFRFRVLITYTGTVKPSIRGSINLTVRGETL